MYIALLALMTASGVLLAVTFTLGLTLDGQDALYSHFLLGFSSVVTNCFVHVLAMFYLIGTGVDIREAVEEDAELTAKFVPLTRQFKRRLFPPATLSIAFVILAALLGGEVHSRIVDNYIGAGQSGPMAIRELTGWWVHGLVVLIALAVQAWAFVTEVRVVRENRAVILEINAALQEKPDEAARAGT